jgi:predicted RNA-binding Zn ribbon-like protein
LQLQSVDERRTLLFSHDTEHSLACVVDLVNSAPTAGNEELLPDLDALSDFVARHDVSEITQLTRGDLQAVHELRNQIRPIFGAPDDATAAQIINRLVSQAPVTPRLSAHDGYTWHMHYFSPGASLAEHLAVDGGVALAQVISVGERERLRRCDAPDCEQVLVDLSRNRSKRYCDARTCGNRLHVAAYRERRRAATG